MKIMLAQLVLSAGLEETMYWALLSLLLKKQVSTRDREHVNLQSNYNFLRGCNILLWEKNAFR